MHLSRASEGDEHTRMPTRTRKSKTFQTYTCNYLLGAPQIIRNTL